MASDLSETELANLPVVDAQTMRIYRLADIP